MGLSQVTNRAQDIARDIVLGALSIIKGHMVTMKNLALRPRVTEQYPEVMPELPRNFRGGFALIWDDERDRPRCIACQMCARGCPNSCIYIEGDDQKGKNRQPVVFDLDMSVCMYCGLCVETCPHDALTTTPEFEFAALEQEDMIVDLEWLVEEGKELGIGEVLRPEEAVSDE
jgi:NADH-quinone oxidoreductase subunit I